MNPTFQELMRDATRLTRGGHLAAATAAIQRALGGASTAMPAPDPRSPSGTLQAKPSTGPAEGRSLVLEGCVLELVDRVEAGTASAPEVAEMPGTGSPRQGEFIAGAHAHASLTRHYKLFVPPGADQRRLPLVVMLHGCTQDPDDFAAGTGMNALAREQGFYVLYPAQAQDANPSRCWNWFKHNHQARDRGETAVIATMTHAVIRAHGVDPERVYIAGLSAGGAMAALVAAAYPDTFAAVGVHSGLPPGVARSLPEGLAAMRAGSGADRFACRHSCSHAFEGKPCVSVGAARAGHRLSWGSRSDRSPAQWGTGRRGCTQNPCAVSRLDRQSPGHRTGCVDPGSALYALDPPIGHRADHRRALAGARRGPRLVGWTGGGFLHRCTRARCQSRDAALLPRTGKPAGRLKPRHQPHQCR